jgi:hypothetical protein
MMNMHLWHRAAGNRSAKGRVGIFNKYAGRHAPPATGYFLFTDGASAALAEHGKSLLAVHSDRPLAITRALLERTRSGAREFLLIRDGNGFPVPYEPDGAWLTRERIEAEATLIQDFVQRAIADWLAPGIVRGKGLSQAQSRIDQFAY